MFEKASELRDRYRQQAERKAEERGLKSGLERGQEQQRARRREAMTRFGVEVDGVRMLPDTPEVREFLGDEN